VIDNPYHTAGAPEEDAQYLAVEGRLENMNEDALIGLYRRVKGPNALSEYLFNELLYATDETAAALGIHHEQEG
jgi:hypothetical protein